MSHPPENPFAGLTAGGESAKQIAKELRQLSDQEILALLTEQKSALSGNALRWMLSQRISGYAWGDRSPEEIQNLLIKGRGQGVATLKGHFLSEFKYALNRMETGADDSETAALMDAMAETLNLSPTEAAETVKEAAVGIRTNEVALGVQEAELASVQQIDAVLAPSKERASFVDRRTREAIRAVANAGVNPDSPEGKRMVDVMAPSDPDQPGATLVNPEVMDLIASYQSRLVGPIGSQEREMYGFDGGGFSGGIEGYEETTQRYGYTKDQAFTELDKLSTPALKVIQQRLVGVGLLRGNYIAGRPDEKSQDAMLKLMELAGIEGGKGWGQTLFEYERRVHETGELLDSADGTSGSGQERVFRPDSYVAPDYATMAEDVESLFRQKLKRAPDESEIAGLVAEMTGWHKEAADVSLSKQRTEFDGKGGGTVTAVNPGDRFKRFFKEKYAPEIDFVEDKDEAVLSRAVVEGGAGTLSSMSKGN